MDGIFIAHAANGILMIALPVGLAIFLTRRWKLGWRLWLIGAATFILSQVGHIPFNLFMGALLNRTPLAQLPPAGQLLFNAAFLGLSAGLFEELFRYGMYRWWATDARSWRTGVLTGAGHGGAEAILLGFFVLLELLQLAALRGADLAALVPADQLAAAQEQVGAYWSMTWYDSLLGALERALTIPVQIALAVIVLQCFVRGQHRWLWLAVGFHAVIDASAVLAIRHFGVYGTEAMVAGYCALSIGILYLLRRPEPPDQEPRPTPPAAAFTPRPVEETPQKLDDTRFS
ncbi:MAG: YhfC family intramembrane metalloprotease [Anaerolineales bacterium]|nr:YhfC family intramembrane metalloprotease [Anaerolineales bacterium]